MASNIVRFSMFLGKLPPEAFDAIFPHGPVLSRRASDLNPHPDPVAWPLALPVAARARAAPRLGHRPGRVVGALSLASVAGRLEAGELQDALAKGAEQLLEAGHSQ